MDLSALIFVALAVAWAVYLVPKALKHHDDVVRSRSVDRFSHTMRVLARREPVDRRNARLVVSPGRAAASSIVTTKATTRTTESVTETVATSAAPATPVSPVASATSAEAGAPVEPTPAPALTPASQQARRAAANRAARRRRNVLASILLVNLVVLALAAFSVLSWWAVAAPAGLLVAWLVACRLMVKQERATASRRVRPRRQRRPAERYADEAGPEPDTSGITVVPVDDWTADTSSIPVAVVDPALWDPVPVTLPTYVTKPAAARRTVRTIDLDSTGVWTSGRTEGDAALAREAEQADQARKAQTEREATQRAVGS
ncbi:hypothetical protein [Nocardioides panaciterrulae]|uniref:Uncharacterized protein n=1 Tax=Nocardioides panaciterrulae TaxID=661492 RepID=A0A7Y9E8S2_9ACTN|nr:hypothetical protein [Nocardioides panaciterrulae]NYD43324.1 hypothetical protein [Nocardioides panaciterrulae]